jgi:hypothetical protein
MPGRADAQTASVLAPGDLRFVGSFQMPTSITLPGGALQDASFGTGFALRRVGGELRALTATLAENVYEVRVPPVSPTGPAPVADVLRVWGDVTAGQRRLDGRDGAGQLRGLYVDDFDRRLYWTYGDAYNTQSAADPSMGVSVLDDATGTARAIGSWSFTGRSCKMALGGVCAVPRWFALRHTGGRRLAVGFGGYESIVATGPASMGPALTAFDPNVLRRARPGTAVANTPLLGYPFNPTPYTTPDRSRRSTTYRDDFDGWNPRNGEGFWTWSDYIGQAGVWVDTPSRHGFVVFPNIATGRVWYETSTLRAEGAEHWCHIYDPADLGRVADGAVPQWGIQPQHIVEMRFAGIQYPMNGWADGPQHMVVGSAFDRRTKRIYVAIRRPWSPSAVASGHTVAVYEVP